MAALRAQAGGRDKPDQFDRDHFVSPEETAQRLAWRRGLFADRT
jgi:hypothetical protein